MTEANTAQAVGGSAAMKVRVIVLALLLCAALAGCGADRSASETTTTQTESTQAPATTQQASMPEGYPVVFASEAEKAAYLRSNGIAEDTLPFYQYHNDDGTLRLALFYDLERKTGVGIYNGYEPIGFAVGAPEPAPEPLRHDKFAVLRDDIDTSQLAGYTEKYTCNSKKQVTRFEAQWMPEYAEEPEMVADVEFIYRNDGTLKQKRWSFGWSVVGTYRCSEMFYYDARERLVYVAAYVTHGQLEEYYIYQGNVKKPSYRLTLDFGWGSALLETLA